VTLALGCGRGPSRFANGRAVRGSPDATPSIAPSVDGVPVPAAKKRKAANRKKPAKRTPRKRRRG
jgi:hypothetical protein